LLYIGIDLGTSNVKLLLVNKDGNILKMVSREYDVAFPHTGWAEQNPADWWDAVCDGVKELIADTDSSEIAGIGCGGQMHGLVALDSDDNVIRPVILWNDSRTEKQVEYLNNIIGKENLSKMTGNIAFAGFTAPKLLWMRENEPDNFARISKIMLPKDYINYKLTGVHACDFSDASGMLLLDVEHKQWNDAMLEICGISSEIMPRLFESYEVISTVLPEIAHTLGLPQNVRVVAGAGDNAASAIGTGTIGAGKCNISLGTSGTIFISNDKFKVDDNNALHSFAHADGGYHLMGCMLSAASCNKWFCEEILNVTDFSKEQINISYDDLGGNDVYFLPYLMGERSPINDTNARGTFIGMSMNTTRKQMVQAVLEGVAFAIRDSFEVAKSLGITIDSSKVCGGGAKSALWKKILSNVLNIPLESLETEQGAGYGGAMLAMVGCGEYASTYECAQKIVSVCETVYPTTELVEKYQSRYQKFSKIYPQCKGLFAELQGK